MNIIFNANCVCFFFMNYINYQYDKQETHLINAPIFADIKNEN